MINRIKNAGAYIFVASVAIGLPLISELSGYSKVFAQRTNESQKQELVYSLNKPGYENFKNAIQKNINYLNKHEGLRNESARHGVNALALLLGLAGASCAVASKRKLEGILTQ